MTRANGFTLVELVMVMIVLGVLAAVAIPRLSGVSDYRALEFRDRTVTALRYAQKTAASHRRRVCVDFTATTVALTIARMQGSAASCDLNLNLPGATTNVVTSGDVNAAFSAGNTAFSFLPDGTGANKTISIGGQADIVVVGATGHVH